MTLTVEYLLVACDACPDLVAGGSLKLYPSALERGADTLLVEFELLDTAVVRLEMWNLGGNKEWATDDDCPLASGPHWVQPPRFWDSLDVGVYEFGLLAKNESAGRPFDPDRAH